jgi:hypothetical protein
MSNQSPRFTAIHLPLDIDAPTLSHIGSDQAIPVLGGTWLVAIQSSAPEVLSASKRQNSRT